MVNVNYKRNLLLKLERTNNFLLNFLSADKAVADKLVFVIISYFDISDMITSKRLPKPRF